MPTSEEMPSTANRNDEVLSNSCGLPERPISFESLLLLSARKGDIDGVRKALGQHVDIDYKNKHGTTALYLAVDNDQVPLAKFLLESGAQWRIPYYTGLTAKGLAERSGSVEMRSLFEGKL